jgi:periplasmic copper chaperone A
MENTMRSFISAPALIIAALFAMPVWADNAAHNIQISNGYVRAVPPAQPNTAAFMQLHNSGNSPHALVNAKTTHANIVELHTHTMEDGMMKMRQVDKIDLPAGDTVLLQPGGLHVMLIDLVAALPEEVALTLVFEDGSETELMLPVHKPGHKMNNH